MADRDFSITTGTGGAAVKVALAAATAKTVLELRAAANKPFKLFEAYIGFDGTSGTGTPVLVELIGRYTTRATGTAAIVSTMDEDTSATADTTAVYNATVEPVTGIVVLDNWLIHPQTAQLYQLPLGREWKVKSSGSLALRVTAAAIVNCLPTAKIQE